MVLTGLLLASGLLHVVVIGSLPRQRPGAGAAAAPQWITLAIESQPSPAARATPETAARAPARRPDQDAARASGVRAPAAPPSRELSPPLAVPPAVATAPAPLAVPRAVAAAPPPASSPARVDLAPRSAALSAEPVAAAAATPATPEALAARRGAQLSAELRAVANANPNRQRRAPQLERDTDGTCHYNGDAIDATILPDGGVRFEDRAPEVAAVSVEPLQRGQLLPRGGVAEPPARPVTPEEQVVPQQLELRVRARPRAWQAERAWFLRQTQALRQQLADSAHERELAQDEHALRKRLDRIWCDAAKAPATRRRALFELWDSTSDDDEIGARGRRVILAYIRENLPRRSGFAYAGAELVALNSARRQRDAFDPYGAPVPGNAALSDGGGR